MTVVTDASRLSPASILPRSAARFGDKTALVSEARGLSFAELDAFSDRVAAWLRSNGIEPGDRVSLYSENRWEWIVAYHGVLKADAVVNPLNVMLTPEEVGFATSDCGAVGLFGSCAKLAPLTLAQLPSVELFVSFDPMPGMHEFDELLEQPSEPITPKHVAPAGLCSIGYTSGTTGFPKGAMQSHRSILLNCALTATMHGRRADDVVVTALPAPHVYGNVAINATLMVGGTVRLLERFDPAEVLAEIGARAATMVEGVPAMYSTMLSHEALGDADLSSLTRCTVGGQTISPTTMRAWESAAGSPLIELWGMTELSGLGTTHALHAPNVHGSIGVPLPGVDAEVRAMDGSGATLGPDEAGELVVRGPIVMLGYFANERATAEAISPDGWLHTGDVAVASEDGHLFIVDRLKDVIITAGYNVYPAEIERVVASHESVALVAVGPIDDATKGELACAYVVPRPGAVVTESDILEHCRPHLAAYKLPRAVAFVSELPTTSSGKVMRRKLAELRGVA